MPTRRTRAEQAAYMRDYRDRKAHAKAEGQMPLGRVAVPATGQLTFEHDEKDDRIAALEARVADLTEEVRVLLAAPPVPSARPAVVDPGRPGVHRVIRSNSLDDLFADPIRAMSQAERDAILRRVSPPRRDR